MESGLNILKVEINREFVIKLVGALEKNKAEEIRAYDVRGQVDYADYIVIVNANSSPHSRGLFSKTQGFFKEYNIEPYNRKKRHIEKKWVVCDYIDVIVHIFLPEERSFYHLDDIFKDASIIYPKGARTS